MPRTHLVRLSIAEQTKEAFRQGYSLSTFKADVLAGLTVAIIAIPLSMALAIAIGLAPQYGLYTAIVAGIVAPLLGGSRFSVTGPTAAFIVLLAPIVQDYGYTGLLITTIMSGAILCLLALARLGRYIEYIPSAVTLGFTTGIAIVIAVYQLEYLLGAILPERPDSVISAVVSLSENYRSFFLPAFLVGFVTIGIYIGLKKFLPKVPAYLPAIVFASLFACLFEHYSMSVDTIGSVFQFINEDGVKSLGIPNSFPSLFLPWNTIEFQNNAWNVSDFVDLLPSAFALAMLGAIESLLCAVALDGVTNNKHSSNTELFAQGVSNVISPFFGGFTSTAAIARSSANYQAGAKTVFASVFHGLFVLFGMLMLAPLISYIPMSGLAALLLIVAWNMAELGACKQLLQKADMSDIVVFLVCMSLTVFVDMVVAILTGILLSSLLFVRTMSNMTTYKRVPRAGISIYQIEGPLFFAAADRIFDEISFDIKSNDCRKIILSFKSVNFIDAGGISALKRFLNTMQQEQKQVTICDLQGKTEYTISKIYNLVSQSLPFKYFRSLEDATRHLLPRGPIL